MADGNGTGTLDHPRLAKATKAELMEAILGYDMTVDLLQERMVDLELAIEDAGWQKLSADASELMTTDAIGRILDMARASYLTNPLIHHAVNVQADYVFAQGLTIRAKPGDAVNQVLQDFWDDPANQCEISTMEALWDKEVQLQLEANIFFVFFTNINNGKIKVRTIPVEEILHGQIICNPNDRKEPWFYKRVWTPNTFNPETGTYVAGQQIEEYYPDWKYAPPNDLRPATINGKVVHWNQPVYHVALGTLGKSKIGISEIYSALDWARAVRLDLEDYATIKRSLARFAWQLKTKGGKQGVARAKSKLESALGIDTSGADTNPAPVAGSALIAADGREAAPIRTAGSTISPEEGRRMWLMVSAGTGIPETILAGNADVGNMATARTLDRPTELQMRMRQQLWQQILRNIGTFVIESSVRALGSPLTGDLHDGIIELRPRRREGGKLVTQKVTVEVAFPSILERDKLPQVDAVVHAATLRGRTNAGIFPSKELVKRLLVALGEDDVDGAMEAIEREQNEPGGVPVTTPEPAVTGATTT